MKKILQLCLALLLSGSVAAQAANNHFDFSDVGVGARAIGMGRSFTSIADDSTAIFWNPAGLARVKGVDASLMFFNAFETNYQAAQATAPFWGVNWGIGYVGAKLDGAIGSSSTDSDGRWVPSGTFFGYQANAVYLSAAKAISDRFSVGVSAKYISETLDTNTGTGYGLDVGALYTMSPVTIGLNIQNIISPAITWDTASRAVDQIPLTIRGGISTTLMEDALRISLDLQYREHRTDSLRYFAGAEYWLYPFIPVRAGYDFNRLTLGTGIHVDNFVVDFAWSAPDRNDLNNIEDPFRVSFGYRMALEVPEALEPASKSVSPASQPAIKELSVVTAPPATPPQPVVVVIAPTPPPAPAPVVALAPEPVITAAPVVAAEPVVTENVETLGVPVVPVETPAVGVPLPYPTPSTPAPSPSLTPLSTSLSVTPVAGGAITTYAIQGGDPDTHYVVGVSVRDIQGMKVKDLVAEHIVKAGHYEETWDLTNTKRKKLKNGVYEIRAVVTSESTSSISSTTVTIENGALRP